MAKSMAKSMATKSATEAAATGNGRWCFAWVPKVKSRTKAALLNESRWPVGSVITVGFLDGSPALQERVAGVARMWTAPGLANLAFVFKKNAADCMVRISFKYEGSWSVIGTQCLSPQVVPAGEATMNYGWLTDDSTDDEVREVVLHEFGHAIGLLHEHQSPRSKIKWNKKQVYKDLSKPPNSWDKATIDFNMFEMEPKSKVTATAFDTKSIMLYSFPASWTTDGFSTKPNGVLSARDKKLIHAVYP